MKIIDLAEKQRNNETLPKHIRYENEDLYFDGISYYDEKYNNDLFDILAMNNAVLTHLYDEVEIVEEPKKIPEKLKTLKHSCNFDRHEEILYENQVDLANKITEILDYLKSKGE